MSNLQRVSAPLQVLAFAEYAVSLFKGPMIIIPLIVISIVKENENMMVLAFYMMLEKVTSHYNSKDLTGEYKVLKICMNTLFITAVVQQNLMLFIQEWPSLLLIRICQIQSVLTLFSLPFYSWLRTKLTPWQLLNYRECLKMLHDS